MKPEGNDTLDTFIRQAVGKEPFYSFSRVGDTSVQWIQLLQALDKQDLPGWPLLSPVKVQMQKCDKCAQEFCSTINYRRHMRMHRRRLNLDKDSTKYRDLVGQFWDKLTLEEMKELVSFKDGQLEANLQLLQEVSCSTIVKSLTSLILSSGFHSLPQVYVNAGSTLLDIIQSRPTSFPISSQDLFNILEEASERTFLYAGTADSVQKYVFEGDAGKTSLEMKNIIACTCFMLEQKLVKAWVANKDAEALRCQKLLVEEEEAAKKRQSDLVERRRKKKLRQRLHKAKSQTNIEDPNSTESASDILDDMPVESSVSLDTSPSPSHDPLAEQDNTLSLQERIATPNMEEDAVSDDQAVLSMENLESGTYQNIEQGASQRNGHKRLVVGRWKVPKSQSGAPNGFHDDQNPGPSKRGSLPRNRTQRISRVAHVVNGKKVWTRKPKVDNNNNENLYLIEDKEVIDRPRQDAQCELLIGSIPVTLANCGAPQDEISLTRVRDSGGAAHPVPKHNSAEDRLKSDVNNNNVNRSTGKQWRPVSRHSSSGPTSDHTEPEVEIITREDDNPVDENGQPRPLSKDAPGFIFSSRAAKAFLAERWKEAMSADHVKLVLSPETTESPVIQNGSQETPASAYSEQRSILEKENRNAAVDSLSGGTATNSKLKKSEKGVKLKFIPKQRR